MQYLHACLYIIIGSVGDVLVLTCTGADQETLSNNEVYIGASLCDVTAATASEVTCTITRGELGEHDVVFRYF